jgi:tRNA-dihydrouridine synthase B
MKTFWQTLPKPLIGLSPMDGVTDQPFRHIVKKYGQPALIYTEFTSVEGVCHGAARLLRDFLYDPSQRPIIGQIYGTTPDFFRQTAIILCQLGFDGIDLNMGCPAKNVAHSGAGAALIRTPELAQAIVRATQQGIQDWHNGASVTDCADITSPVRTAVIKQVADINPEPDRAKVIPVSVKTRVGFDSKIITEWVPYLLECEPAAIAIHGRMLKQYYGGLADWSEIAKAVELAQGTETLILGNGDIQNLPQAQARIAETGVHGVLIGRAAMGNPWVFDPTVDPETPHPLRFTVAVEHAELYEQTYRHEENYSFLPMRKHLGWYVKGIPNAAQIRTELFQAGSAAAVKEILQRSGVLN